MKNPKKPARLPRKAPSNQTGGTAWGKKLAAEISRMAQAADMKKLILLNFPYIIAFYMVEKAAWLYRHCNGDSVVDRLMVLFMNFGLAYKSVLPSFHPFDLMVGLVGAAALKAVIYFKGKNAKKYRQGEEYGSARWGNQKDIEPFIDPVFENNVILTQTERLMMSGRPKHPKYARNKNVIVIGGSGSGKTRFYVKPNLMQMPQKVSYVVTDPKGTIIIECGKMLSDAGYKIKVLNTINFKKSIQWFAAKYANAHDVFFVGRGIDYAVCLEGSLKLKEISYIHSEAYAAGELKHGTISLIEQGTLVIGVLTQSELYEKTISNMLECKSRGAYLMGLTTYGKYETEDQVNFTVYVPKVDEHFVGSLAVIPLQLLGYYVSVAKGLDVDKPRNLAKSVTVE